MVYIVLYSGEDGGDRMKPGFAAFLVLLFTTGEVLAQSDRATIRGTVKDASGAVIAGGLVVLTHVNDNSETSASTDAEGRFTILNLPIGQYTLVCSKERFEKYERSGLVLAISQATEIDIVLPVGSRKEAVTVVGDALQLQRQTSSISTNLNNAAVTQLPLNVQGRRNLSTFIFDYVPGVEGTGVNPSDKDFASHINGSLSATKEVMIDGTSAVSQIGGYLSESSPPMEAVQEFQVTSAGIAAEDGRTGGGVFRYEMKSGTNAWHGSGVFYMHNEALDARSWGDVYNEAQCLSAANGDPAQTASCQRGFGKPSDSLYDYGASFGGPIKKDKLFFYAAWERYTFANAGIGALSSTVPTAEFLSGNFSALLDKSAVLGTDGAGQTV